MKLRRIETMEQRETREEIEIDLKGLFAVLWSKKWIIIFSGIILALLAGGISEFVMPEKYESSTKVYVLNRQTSDTVTYSDLQTGSQLMKDYQELAVSRTVLEQAILELNLSMSTDELAGMLTVSAITDTRILKITVANQDPYLARSIAFAVREAASVHIRDVMNIESLNVVEDANLPESPSSPNVTRNALLGGILGIVSSVLILFVVFMLDDTIKTAEDVERYLEVSVLASIPVSKAVSKRKRRAERRKSG